MTDVVEGTVNVSDPAGQPNQAEKGALQVSDSSLDVKAIAAEVANILKPELQKMNQSEKDKRFAKFEKFMEELAKPEAAVEQPAQPVQNGQQTTVTTAQGSGTAVQQNQPGKVEITDEANEVLLKSMGLDPSDPDVTAITDKDPIQRIMSYNKILQRREQANPAAVAGASGQKVDNSALVDELMSLQQSDPLDRNGRQRAIKKQLGW